MNPYNGWGINGVKKSGRTFEEGLDLLNTVFGVKRGNSRAARSDNSMVNTDRKDILGKLYIPPHMIVGDDTIIWL